MNPIQLVAQVALSRLAAGALTHVSRGTVTAPPIGYLPVAPRETLQLSHRGTKTSRPVENRLVRTVPSQSREMARPLTRLEDAEKAFLQKNIQIALKTRRREELKAGSSPRVAELRFRRDWFWRTETTAFKRDFWIDRLENEIDDLVAKREGVVKKFFLGREAPGSGSARKRVHEIGTLWVDEFIRLLEDLLKLDSRTPDFYWMIMRFEFRMACLRYLETAGRQDIGRGTLIRIRNLSSRCLGEIRRIQGLTG